MPRLHFIRHLQVSLDRTGQHRQYSNSPSVLSRACLKGRNPDADAPQRRITAYQTQRNAAGATINWRFSTHDARTKLHRFHPCLSNIDRVMAPATS